MEQIPQLLGLDKVAAALNTGLGFILSIGNVLIWILILWGIYKLIKRMLVGSHETFQVQPQIHQLQENLKSERNLAKNWIHYAQEYEEFINSKKLGNHPNVWNNWLKVMTQAFFDRELYPPRDLSNLWATTINLAPGERVLYAFNPHIWTVKYGSLRTYHEGEGECVLTNYALYLRYEAGLEFIRNDNFAVLETYKKTLTEMLSGQKMMGVQRRQPGGHLKRIEGRPEDIDFVYRALMSGWNKGPTNQYRNSMRFRNS